MSTSSAYALPAEASAAGAARAHVRDWLTRTGLAELDDVVVLLASEVVTNAVLHAGSASSLLVERWGTGVRVTVTDASPVLPARRRRSGTATTGRGCQLLADLSDSWGAEPDGVGKRVWFVVSGARDPWAGIDADTLLEEAEL